MSSSRISVVSRVNFTPVSNPARFSRVRAIIAACPDVHVLRDLTRGGLAGALCDIAETAGVGIRYREVDVPVPAEVRAACTFLGLDPMHVANRTRCSSPPLNVSAGRLSVR